MGILFQSLNAGTEPDLFTLLWVSGLVLLIGAVVVYNIAQNRYRRYPTILALHEWVFWPVAVAWGLTPLLTVIGVPLLLVLLVQLPALAVPSGTAVWFSRPVARRSHVDRSPPTWRLS